LAGAAFGFEATSSFRLVSKPRIMACWPIRKIWLAAKYTTRPAGRLNEMNPKKNGKIFMTACPGWGWPSFGCLAIVCFCCQ
jgi:hypothetical protein